MKKKGLFRFSIQFFSAILLLSSIFSQQDIASAQEGGMLALHPEGVQTEPAPSHQEDDWDLHKDIPLHNSAPSELQAYSEAAALGQTGLSYRYVETFGVSEQAYPSSTDYLNRPKGLYIDGSNNLYVSDERGCRVLKYNSSGTNTLEIGTAGLCYQGEQTFGDPNDIALDGSGNIWVADGWGHATQFDSSGVYQQDLYDTGNSLGGVAFDSSGKMFVSETDSHRIQVYTFSGGEPVYSASIGEEDVSGSDNSHFNQPSILAVDSSDRLYVVDQYNNRIQRCADSGGWSCTTFASGFDSPQGISIDTSDNVFVVDSGNNRIQKCTSGGVCSDVVTGFPGWIADVVTDSAGNIYASDWTNEVVRKYSSTGTSLGVFLGTVDTPYIADTSRIYTPYGVAIASDGSIYYTENLGYRLGKLNSAGVQHWAVGQAGVYGDDNDHFGSYWTGPQGDLALDNAGHVYVPDTANHRIQVFNENGAFVSSFGSWGTGNTQFKHPRGVAIHPTSGDIYVVDNTNHRIQVFTSNWAYKATIGTTGVSGSDGTHFNYPSGIAVDTSGAVFVSDGDNYRVQKCLISGSSGSCTTFAGQTGVDGGDFAHLGYPEGLAVDSTGRVFVADRWNNRVQIYDNAGAYLTTIGGNWGARTGELRNPADVSLDANGNVYITDPTNSRIQKFSPGVAGWEQTNINGFGSPYNATVLSLTPFNGELFAGTGNYNGTGAQLWRYGSSWTSVMTNGFGDTSNEGVDDLIEFNGQLYAGTWNWDSNTEKSNGGEIWRSSDGSTWSQVASGGLGDTENGEFFRFAIFDNQIYAGTWRFDDTNGTEIWRSSTGDSGSWTRVVDNGFDDIYNLSGLSFESYNGYFYSGTYNTTTGGEIWRSSDGATWAQVNSDGFGDVENSGISALSVFNNYLYALTSHKAGAGSQIWRCQTCDGTDWSKVVASGFGDVNTRGMAGLEVANNQLYAIVGNSETGLEIWRTTDGLTWEQEGPDGLGDSNNFGPYWDNSIVVYDNALQIGTSNYGNGGEVWRYNLPITPTPTLGSISPETVITGSPDFTLTATGTGFSDGDVIYWNNSALPTTFVSNTQLTAIVPAANVAVAGTAEVKVVFLDTSESETMFIEIYTFADVPTSHEMYDHIMALYNAGYTAGCSTDPLMYCPDTIMNRSMGAVFMLRGQFGSSYSPAPATGTLFADMTNTGAWDTPFAEAMYNEGLSAGCGSDPLRYCPVSEMTRQEASVFGLRLKYGMSYTPPPATGTLLADMTNTGSWATPWCEQAYLDGLLPECGWEGDNPLFCPEELVDRGWGAYLVVEAKGLLD